MHTTEHAAPTKKITITVNGEPIGRDLIIDSVTYVPVQNEQDGRSRGEWRERSESL